MKRTQLIILTLAALALMAFGLAAAQRKSTNKPIQPATTTTAMKFEAVEPQARKFIDSKCPACSFSAVQQPYDAVRLALTADLLADAQKNAAKLRAAAEAEVAWAKTASGRGPELARPFTTVAAAAAKIERASSITEARKAFGEASEAMRAAMTIAERDDVLVVYCPMVKLHWLQPKGEVRNPYGSSMPNCGSTVKP